MEGVGGGLVHENQMKDICQCVSVYGIQQFLISRSNCFLIS